MIKILISLMLILTCQCYLSSQVITKDQLSVTEKNLFNDAKKASQSGDIQKSNKKYLELLKLQPNFAEAKLRLASNYFSMKLADKAEQLFQETINQFPDYDPEMYFSLATIQENQNKYVEAATNYETYLLKEKKNVAKLKKATVLKDNLLFKVYARQHPVPFNPINMGPAINSLYSEYSPSLAIDGSSMIFTRNIGQEDFFISAKDSLNGFKTASPLFNLNTVQNEGAHSLSADGKFMVFTSCDRRDAFGSCDLYFSTLMDGKWSLPVNMGHVVNSAAWDSQPTLSPDGKTIIFSSRRKGTLGGADLWITWRDEKNSWVPPVNLGPEINSEKDDESPFLHPDGQTLYFRSDGRPGMGNFDIFLSRRNISTGAWLQPVNIGYPINTEGEEGALIVSLDGQKAYFATDMNYVTGKCTGNLDIYSFELYKEARPIPTTYVKGYITDAQTGKSVQGKVTIKDLKTGSVKFQITTDKDGYFICGISTGSNYICIIENNDYQYYTQNFNLSSAIENNHPYLLNIRLIPILEIKKNTVNAPVVLHNIFFNSGSAELMPESSTEINLLYNLLSDHPELKIKITGHTDNVGMDNENLQLSILRAAAVKHALIDKGIEENRVISEGKGESSPIATNDTEEGRQKNRRTEFVLSVR